MRETKEMNGIIQAVEQTEAARSADAKQAHETEREEIRNKNLEGINELRINLENKIEDLEKQFDDAHKNYVENTEQANKHFKELQREDKKLSKIIDTKKRKIERMQGNLAYWKKKIEQNYKECVARNRQLKEQKEAIAKHCSALKARRKKLRHNEGKRLTELTVMARNAYRSNEERLSKAEKIIQLAELGRKLETEREKVQPFYESTIQNNVQATEGKTATVKTLEEGEDYRTQQMQPISATVIMGQDGKPLGRWEHLGNFHKKFNKVLLDKLAISEEKLRLEKENGDLRGILKQYLDGIAVTEDAVDSDNPLMIINGRVNLIDKERQVRRMGPPKTITEANVVVNNTAAHFAYQAM
jgi:DNA repair exonuclease SbcCD ATPase subunit